MGVVELPPRAIAVAWALLFGLGVALATLEQVAEAIAMALGGGSATPKGQIKKKKNEVLALDGGRPTPMGHEGGSATSLLAIGVAQATPC